MTVTMKEALKRVDELENEVDSAKEGFKADVTKWEERAKALADQVENFKEESLREQRRADRLLEQKNELERKLAGYGDLAKALGAIRGDGMNRDQVREIIKEEASKLVGSGPAVEGVSVTESVPNIDFRVSKPWVPLDESTVEGQIAVLVLHDKLPAQFKLSDAAKQRELEYAVHGKTVTIQKALDALVGKYKVIERKLSGNQYVYSLRADAKSRVKETETREAAEAKSE